VADLISRMAHFADPANTRRAERLEVRDLLREASDEILRLTTLLAEGHGQTSTEEEACPRCHGRGTTEAGELSGLSDYPCTPCGQTGRMMITRCVSCDSIVKQEVVESMDATEVRRAFDGGARP